MENEVSSNTQATSAAAPVSTGPTVEELMAQKAELERQSEGRLRDLQEERRKRQELEQRLSSVPASPAAQNPGVEQMDEVAKVLNPYTGPIDRKASEAYKMAQEMYAEFQRNSALSYLAQKTGKSVEQIQSDSNLQQRLDATARKYGFTGTLSEVARKSYEVMELEDFRAQQAEKARAAQAASQASLPAGAPPAPVSNSREYSADDFNRLAPREFDQLSRGGSFRKVGDKFVYTPH